MNYQYDHDLIDAIPSFEIFDLTNPKETRKKLIEVSKSRPLPDATGVSIEDFYIDGNEDGLKLKVRSYRADNLLNKTLPALFNIHGGGFVIGRIEVDDAVCIDIARRLSIAVFSVEYRLSPEFTYPAAIEDCFSTLKWLYNDSEKLRIDPNKIIVHGTSAGGGLAAALTHLSRDRNGPKIFYQFLDLPELDDRLNSTSMTKFTDTPGWNKPNAELSWKHYLGDLYGSNNIPPYAAPSRANDFKKLPPAYIAAFEYDPLRNEAIDYAEKLFSHDIPLELHIYKGAYHLAYLITNSDISKQHHEDKLKHLEKIINF